MKLLTDAFEYNFWATMQLAEVCAKAPAEELSNQEDWQYQPILELWWHINQVERAYLRLMGAQQVAEPDDDFESLIRSEPVIRDNYVDFVGGISDVEMERLFEIPWFEREFTVRDGLFQVLAHSIEHRADIAHFLSRLGHETPPIDYIAWVQVKDGGVLNT